MPRRPATSRIAPLVPVAITLMAGIVMDRAFSPWSCVDWSVLAGVLALTASVVTVPERLRLAAIAGALVALGGAWHHARWSYLPPDDLAWVVDTVPRVTERRCSFTADGAVITIAYAGGPSVPLNYTLVSFDQLILDGLEYERLAS